MKKITIAIIFSLIGSLPLMAQNTFQHSYGTKGRNLASCFVQTTDKGFALLGTNDNSGNFVELILLETKYGQKLIPLST